MAVNFDITQSGSGSSKISAQSGDVITFVLAATTYNSQLAQSIAQLAPLANQLGITFAVSTSGNAS